jgi:hypothetical protein
MEKRSAYRPARRWVVKGDRKKINMPTNDDNGSKQLFFRAEPDLRAAVVKAAADEDRSVSDFLRLLVLKEFEKRRLLAKRKRRPGRRRAVKPEPVSTS